MNILNIEHVSKIFGEKKIFDEVSYGIHEGDKIGVIGINGTGKSTLLKMIAGLEETDEGHIIKQNGLRITYIQITWKQNKDTSQRRQRAKMNLRSQTARTTGSKIVRRSSSFPTKNRRNMKRLTR